MSNMALMFRSGSRICAVALNNLDIVKRGIAGRALREILKTPPRPPPFDWRRKEYTVFTSWFDRTTSRFDDNTKIIVVDGPIAAGKTDFAKKLADDLDMKHFPEATLDEMYINYYGLDLRDLDPKLPENCRTFDHKNFCQNPNHINAASFQISSYMSRYSQYMDALAHMFNSGQGVVLERSPFSDFVFADAMRACGYIGKGAHSYYKDARDASVCELLRPHLVIYLDIPVNVVKERVKKRNYAYEKDSKIFNNEYLEALEKSYKEKYLKQIGEHSLMLVYDWTGYGDMEIVVEDIEKLDFDCFNRWDDIKLKDYYLHKESDWSDLRMKYSQNHSKAVLMNEIAIGRVDVPEVMITGEESYLIDKVLCETPGYQYAAGYDKAMGDKILFKSRTIFDKEVDHVKK